MSFNPAQRISLDAYPAFRGVPFHAKDKISDKPMRKAERFMLANGREVAFAGDVGYEAEVPVVSPFATLLPFFQQFSAMRYGQVNAPHSFLVESVDLTSNVVTITAHPFLTGDILYPRWEETPPTATPVLAAGTAIYVFKIDANTFTLHADSSAASAGTGAQDFTALGTGAWWLAHQFPLVINRRSGVARTYLNAAVQKLPMLKLNGGQLFWDGPMAWNCYPKIGAAVSEANAAFFTEAPAAYTSPAWDGSAVLTAQNLTLSWGGSAPWASFFGEEGVQISFEPKWASKGIGNGVFPRTADILEGFKVTAKVKPIGITVPQLAALFAEQLGSQLSLANDLVITVGGKTITLYGAVIPDPQATIFSVKDSVSPELTFEALGNATSDNRPPFLIA